MNRSLFIIYFIFWAMSKIYLLSDDYIIALKLHSLGLHVDLLFVLGYFVWVTPYHQFKLKVFWSCFFNFIFLCTIFYIYSQLIAYDPKRIYEYGEIKSAAWSIGFVSGIIHEFFVPLFPLWINYFIFTKLSFFDYSNSAKIIDKNIYLVLVYPKNIVGLVLSIFTPVKANSVFLYADGYAYKFKKEDGYLLAAPISETELESSEFFLINTGIPEECRRTELQGLIGLKWSMTCNCLTEFQKIIGPLRTYLR